MRRIFLTAFLAAFFVTGLAGGAFSQAQRLSPQEAYRLQAEKQPMILVDARPPKLYEIRHITGAINIPAFAVADKGLPKDSMIVVYDGGIGATEAEAAVATLSAVGYARAFVLDGGLALYESLGLPVIGGSGIVQESFAQLITVENLARAMKMAGVLVVDLRDAETFAEGTVPGAVNIRPESIVQASGSWKKDAVTVIVDGGDGASEREAERLRRLGFKLVRYLYGGYPEWNRLSTP